MGYSYYTILIARIFLSILSLAVGLSLVVAVIALALHYWVPILTCVLVIVALSGGGRL